MPKNNKSSAKRISAADKKHKSFPAATPARQAKKQPGAQKRTIKKSSDQAAAKAAGRYLPLNEITPEVEAKKRILWIIVGLFALILVIFWFWSLKKNISEVSRQINLDRVKQEISQTVGQVTGNIKQQQETSTVAAADIAKIKDEIIAEIKANLNSADWPLHSSEVLKISLQYPANWYQQENKNLIAVYSYNPEAAIPKTFGQISLQKFSNPNKLKLDDWLSRNKIDLRGYQAAASTTLVADQAAQSYSRTATGTDDFTYQLFAANNKDIWQISVMSRGGKNLYEPVFEEIIKSIKFLK